MVMFEVEEDDVVIVTATLDDAPFDDAVGGGAKGIAHVGLLKDSFVASASAAIGEELLRGDFGAAGAVNGVNEAGADGVGEGDFEIQIPGTVEGWGVGS